MKNRERLYDIATMLFALTNVIAFFIFYIPSEVLYDAGTLRLISKYLIRFIEITMPPVAAMLLYLGGASEAWGASFLRGIPFAMPRMLYLIPYYFVYFTNRGYSETTIVPSAVGMGLIGALVFFLQMMLLCKILRTSTRLTIKKSLKDDLPAMYRKSMPRELKDMLDGKAAEQLREIPEKPGVFDFSAPVTVGIFSASFGQFIISMLYEGFNALKYLVTQVGSYDLAEMLYILSRFLFVIIQLFVVHIICYGLKNKILKRGIKNENII